jgi:hypothetical protein
MPRAAPQTPVGAIESFSAVDRRPTGQTHQRRSPGLIGPHHPRGAEVELADLRRRLASSENVGTLKSIGEAASELALVAPENLLESIAELIDRTHAKLESLGVAPRVGKRKPAQTDDEMTGDEEGRPISVRKDRLLAKLREVHGEPRTDIPPGLPP